MPACAPAWHRSCLAALELGSGLKGAVSSASSAKERQHDSAVEWHRPGARAAPTGSRVELRVCSAASGARPDLPGAHPVDPPDHARPPPVRVPEPDPLSCARVQARLTTRKLGSDPRAYRSYIVGLMQPSGALDAAPIRQWLLVR